LDEKFENFIVANGIIIIKKSDPKKQNDLGDQFAISINNISYQRPVLEAFFFADEGMVFFMWLE